MQGMIDARKGAAATKDMVPILIRHSAVITPSSAPATCLTQQETCRQFNAYLEKELKGLFSLYPKRQHEWRGDFIWDKDVRAGHLCQADDKGNLRVKGWFSQRSIFLFYTLGWKLEALSPAEINDMTPSWLAAEGSDGLMLLGFSLPAGERVAQLPWRLRNASIYFENGRSAVSELAGQARKCYIENLNAELCLSPWNTITELQRLRDLCSRLITQPSVSSVELRALVNLIKETYTRTQNNVEVANFLATHWTGVCIQYNPIEVGALGFILNDDEINAALGYSAIPRLRYT